MGSWRECAPLPFSLSAHLAARRPTKTCRKRGREVREKGGGGLIEGGQRRLSPPATGKQRR